MAQEHDELPGGPRDGRPPVRPAWPIPVAVIAMIVAIGLAFVVGRTTAPGAEGNGIEERATGGPPGATAQGVAGGGPAESSTDQMQEANKDAAAGPRAMSADFLITDRLLADPPSYEDLQAEAVTTSVCFGDPLRIANVSSQRVGLIDTPAESDASAQLGFVDPGAVFTMEPQEAGTFFISAAGVDGLLFRYSAAPCPRGRPAAR